MKHRGDDRGQLAGGEAIPFGVLIFVVGSLLIANAWAVVDAKFAVDAGAREAARTFAESEPGTPAHQAVENARESGLITIEAHGRARQRARIDVQTVDAVGEAPIQRCTTVTFEAHYTVPAISLPWIGGFGDAFDVVARHSRVVDPFRSGLDGTADRCV